MPTTGEPASRHVAAVSRAMRVLEVLADATEDLGTNEIARRTGINPSSASRLLATLAAGDLVQWLPDSGRYRLGLRLFQLGTAAMGRLDLQGLARPHLTALAAATGETATLSVPGEREAMTVDFVQGASSVQSVARVGRPSVAHATAVGKVFLAHGGELPVGSLLAFTRRTITDPGRLVAEIARVAKNGWAEALAEREADLNAVAVPILGPRRELTAILGVQGPAGRFDRRAMRAAIPLLLERASQISRRTAA